MYVYESIYRFLLCLAFEEYDIYAHNFHEKKNARLFV